MKHLTLKRVFSVLLALIMVISLVVPTLGSSAYAANGNYEIQIGETVAMPKAEGNATWSTSNSSVASVSNDGVVTGVGEGTATITVTIKEEAAPGASYGWFGYWFHWFFSWTKTTQHSYTVTVVKPVQPEEPGTSFELKVGETLALPKTANGAQWSSSDNQIATVSNDGVVTGVKAGTVTITETVRNGGNWFANFFWFFPWWNNTTTTTHEFTITVVNADEPQPPEETPVPETPEPTATPEPEDQIGPFDEKVNHQVIADTAKDQLNIQFSEGDDASAVIHDVILPTELGDAVIAWTSSDESVITNDGAVTRPEGKDVQVTITAQITVEEATATKDFVVTVIHNKDFDEENAENLSVIEIEGDNSDADIDFFIEYSDDQSQVITINGTFSDVIVESSEDAINALYSVRAITGINSPKDELLAGAVNRDKYGVNYTLQQQCGGIPVYGKYVTVSADNEGKTTSLTSDFLPNLTGMISLNAALTPDEAAAAVSELYDGNDFLVAQPETVVYALDDYESNPVLAYVFSVTNYEAACNDSVIINAVTGEVISQFSNNMDWGDEVVTGRGTNELGQSVTFPIQFKQWDWLFYYMQDTGRNITIYDGGLINTRYGSEFNTWNDPTAISAYTNMIKVYDWYKSSLDRRSVDNNGLELKVTVHKNSGYNNACWTGSEFFFFDNSSDSTLQTTTASGLDIIAHEYTHGVVQYMTNGGLNHGHANGHTTYAINEAYADIFGWFVDDSNTTIGESWRTLRNVQNPNSRNLPKEMGGAFWSTDTNNQSAYAHTNSSVISHAAYLMSKGYNSNGFPAISKEKLIDLWYGSLAKGFSASSQFKSVRTNVLLQADSMHLTSAEKKTIRKAFDDVKIYGDRGTLAVVVTDAETGEAIDGANVIANVNQYIDQSAATSNGKASLKLDTGWAHVDITKDGYVSFAGSTKITKETSTELNVILVRAGRGTIRGTITSATTGAPVEGVTLNLKPGWDSAEQTMSSLVTGSDGQYQITADAGYYTVEMVREGYTSSSFNVTVIGNRTLENQNGSISPIMDSTEYRVVLTWGENPSDLDSHLTGALTDGTSFHVYYSNKDGYDANGNHVANLDVDDTTSYGPETVTFTAQIDCTYDYYVHWFSGTGTWTRSEAKVELYNGGRLVGVFQVPQSAASSGNWNVFRIQNGILTTLQTIN